MPTCPRSGKPLLFAASICFIAHLALEGQSHGQCHPPTSQSTNAQYARAWIQGLCRSNSMSVGIEVPAVDVPGIDFSSTDRTCSQSSGSESSHITTLRNYLASDKSLLVAECGFRLCELQRAGAAAASQRTFMERVCAVQGGPGDGLALSSSVFDLKWSPGPHTVSIDVRNLNPTQPIDVSATLNADTIGGVPKLKKRHLKIPGGATASIDIDMFFADNMSIKREAVHLLKVIHASSVYPVAIRVAPGGKCSQWRAGHCVGCTFEIDKPGVAHGRRGLGDYTCEDMQAGSIANVTTALSVPHTGTDERCNESLWWDYYLNNAIAGEQHAALNAILSNGATVVVDKIGKATGTLESGRCTRCNDTTCSYRGTLTIGVP